MFFQTGRKDSSLAAEYLDQLWKDRPALFSAPAQKATLTDRDVRAIEKELGYRLPRPYVDFLQSYQLPERLTVSARFCGDYANCYDPAREDDPFATVEVEWNIPSHSRVADFLTAAREADMPMGEPDDTFLDAGFLKIAEFKGYFVFLDLVTGEVTHIYHEEVYDMSLVYGVDVTDYQQVRDYLSNRALCKDFYDFLRIVCTGAIYNEDRMEFKTLEELREEQASYQPPSEEEMNVVKEKAVEQVMAEQSMTRDEAIQFLAELVQITVEDFKKGLES